jgi:hypothetical protein
MDAFGTTDFRDDLKKVNVPTLVIHGDADAIVPIEGSGLRTHRAVPHNQMCTGERRATRTECFARAGVQRCAAYVPSDLKGNDRCHRLQPRLWRVGTTVKWYARVTGSVAYF